LLGLLGALVIGASVFFLLFTALVAHESSAVENRLRIDWTTEDTSMDPLYIKLTRPLLSGAFLEMAAGFWKPADLEKWKIQIISAGFGRRIQPEHFVASKFWLCTIITTIVFLLQLFQDSVSPMGLVICAVVTFFFPQHGHELSSGHTTARNSFVDAVRGRPADSQSRSGFGFHGCNRKGR
jgi:hypothetical protein